MQRSIDVKRKFPLNLPVIGLCLALTVALPIVLNDSVDESTQRSRLLSQEQARISDVSWLAAGTELHALRDREDIRMIRVTACRISEAGQTPRPKLIIEEPTCKSVLDLNDQRRID